MRKFIIGRQLIECDLPIDWELQRRVLGFAAKQDFAVLGRRGQPG